MSRFVMFLMCVVIVAGMMVACEEDKQAQEKLAYDRETAAMAVKQAQDAGLKVEEVPTVPTAILFAPGFTNRLKVEEVPTVPTAPEAEKVEKEKPKEGKPGEVKPGEGETKEVTKTGTEKSPSWGFIISVAISVAVIISLVIFLVLIFRHLRKKEDELAEEIAEAMPGPGEQVDIEEQADEDQPEDQQDEERPDEDQPDDEENRDQAGRTLVGLLLVLFLGFVLAFVTAPLFAGVTEDRLDSHSITLRANTQMVGKLQGDVKDLGAKVDKAVVDAKAAAAAESQKAIAAAKAVRAACVEIGGAEERRIVRALLLVAGVDVTNAEVKALFVDGFRGGEADWQKICEIIVAAKATVPIAPAVEQASATSAATVDLSGYLKQDPDDPFVRRSELDGQASATSAATVDLSGYLKQDPKNPYIQADTFAGFKEIIEAKVAGGLQDLVRLGVLTAEDLILLEQAKKAEKKREPMPAEARQASIMGRVAKAELTMVPLVDLASQAKATAGQALTIGKAAHREVAPRQKDRGKWAAYALRLHRAELTLAGVGFTFSDVRKDSKQTPEQFRKELAEELENMNVGATKAQEIAKAVTVGLAN